jgi:type VI secretion system protein ImpC
MAEVNIDVDPSTETRSAPIARDSDTPFRIAILGDFSGRKEARPLRSVEIDPGNFEEVMERIGVALELSAGDVRLALTFRDLDDFHPDSIYRSAPLFRAFEEARKELAKHPPAQTVEPPMPTFPPATGGSLLDMIAAQSSPAPSSPSPKRSASDPDAWDDAIRGIVAKHTTPKADPRQQEVAAKLESSAAAAMRAILGHPDFQSLESTWRSIFFLFQHLETGVDLKIYLIDLPASELPSHLADGSLGRVLSAEPYSLIAGLYTFTHSESDCALLSKLASIAKQARAPFISAIHPGLFGCRSIAATPDPDDWKEPAPEELIKWKQLRQSPDADWLGLAMPRFLLRVPYGAKTSEIDSFEFEEMPGATRHESYLWGNPAIACAVLLGSAFSADGWNLRPGSINRIHSIPIHAIGLGEVMPQAEIWMTERLATDIMAEGVMPLASIKHSDAIQLVRFQCIGDPPRPLAGPW